MTAEERFERIEHVTAALVEERRKDREEYRMLWRETNQAITRLAEESRAADQRLEHKIDRVADDLHRFAEEARAADQQLRERIDSLVSAIGKLLTK